MSAYDRQLAAVLAVGVELIVLSLAFFIWWRSSLIDRCVAAYPERTREQCAFIVDAGGRR